MKTFIKTFRDDSRINLETEANKYAEENNLEIVSVAYAVRPYEGLEVYDSQYLAVVYKID